MRTKILIILFFLLSLPSYYHLLADSQKTTSQVIELPSTKINTRLLKKTYLKWKRKKQDFSMDKLSWFISVPSNYDSSKPIGLLIYLSHNIHGKFPHPKQAWENILEKKNLIFVTPNFSISDITQTETHFMVLQGIEHLKSLYKINKKRIYIAGYGGLGHDGSNKSLGGAVDAVSTAILSSNIITGAIFIRGGATWKNLTDPKNPYVSYYGFFGAKKVKRISGISKAKKNHFVFIFEKIDWLKLIMKSWSKKGIKKLLHIENKSRNLETLTSAIEFLDKRK